MKNLKYAFVIVTLFVFGVTMNSCQKETEQQLTQPANKEFKSLPDCGAGCITSRVLLHEVKSVQMGKSQNTKTVDFQIWNTPWQLLTQLISNVPTSKVEYVVDGTTYTYDPVEDIPAGQFIYLYFDLPAGYEACSHTLESVKVFGGGPQLEYTDINYSVYEYCPN